LVGGWLSRGLLISLMMKAARTPETLVNFYQTAQRCTALQKTAIFVLTAVKPHILLTKTLDFCF
jgi:hypothetical protein